MRRRVEMKKQRGDLGMMKESMMITIMRMKGNKIST